MTKITNNKTHIKITKISLRTENRPIENLIVNVDDHMIALMVFTFTPTEKLALFQIQKPMSITNTTSKQKNQIQLNCHFLSTPSVVTTHSTDYTNKNSTFQVNLCHEIPHGSANTPSRWFLPNLHISKPLNDTSILSKLAFFFFF